MTMCLLLDREEIEVLGTARRGVLRTVAPYEQEPLDFGLVAVTVPAACRFLEFRIDVRSDVHWCGPSEVVVGIDAVCDVDIEDSESTGAGAREVDGPPIRRKHEEALLHRHTVEGRDVGRNTPRTADGRAARHPYVGVSEPARPIRVEIHREAIG